MGRLGPARISCAADVLGAQRLPAAVAISYGPEALVAPVAGALLDAAHLAGITLHDILRVEGGRYWSYQCGDEASVRPPECRSMRPLIPRRATWPLRGNRHANWRQCHCDGSGVFADVVRRSASQAAW